MDEVNDMNHFRLAKAVAAFSAGLALPNAYSGAAIVGAGGYVQGHADVSGNASETGPQNPSMSATIDSTEAIVVTNDAYVERYGTDGGAGGSAGGYAAGSMGSGHLTAYAGAISVKAEPDRPSGLATASASAQAVLKVRNNNTYPVDVVAYLRSVASGADGDVVPGFGSSVATGSIAGGTNGFVIAAEGGTDSDTQENTFYGVLWPQKTLTLAISTVGSAFANASADDASSHGNTADTTWNISIAAGTSSVPMLPDGAPGSGSGGGSGYSTMNFGNTGSSTTTTGGPNASAARVYFAPQTSAATVNLDTAVTLGHLTLDGTNSYTLAGPNALTLAGSDGTSIETLAGSHTISASTTVSNDLYLDTTAGSTLSITGPMTFASGVSLTKQGEGTATVPAVHADTLRVTSGQLKISTASGAASNVKKLSLVSDRGAELTAASLNLVNQGSGLVIDTSTTAEATALTAVDNGAEAVYDSNNVRTLIKNGYNGGNWAGPSTGGISFITSTAAAANSQLRIGYATSAQIFSGGTGGTFLGETVDGSAVLLRVCLGGDTNMDGTVNYPDLLKMAQNYDVNGSGKVWSDGDSNYDGVVNFADQLILAQNYNQSGLTASQMSQLDPAFVSDFMLAQSLVPEPTSLLAAGLLAPMLRRRRA